MYFHFTKVMSYKTISKIANMESYGMEERHHFHKPSTRVNNFWFSNFVFFYFKVPTVFWWDNFDRKIDRLSGGGTINVTPGKALQEIVACSRTEEFTINIEKSKLWSFLLRESTPVKIDSVDPKGNPKRFKTVNNRNTEKCDQETRDLLLLTLWKLMCNAEIYQGVPRYVRFLASIYARKDVALTKMTYLPLIHTAITEYRTLLKIFEIFQKFA